MCIHTYVTAHVYINISVCRADIARRRPSVAFQKKKDEVINGIDEGRPNLQSLSQVLGLINAASWPWQADRLHIVLEYADGGASLGLFRGPA